MKKVSIIIRTLNEEDWIKPCLVAIQKQSYKNFEIIIVDNNSNDATKKIAKTFNVKKIVNIKNYYPGYAINLGLKYASGDFGVILSAHCIPKNNDWLKSLIKPFDDTNVVGVYGRQLPLPFTYPDDARDLLITFGKESKLQEHDYTFHNANSAIRLKYWEENKFSNKISNLEDWVWGKAVIENYKMLFYESNAEVWHYHGIHQHGEKKSFRAKSVSQILKNLFNLNDKLPLQLSKQRKVGAVLICDYDKLSNEEIETFIKKLNFYTNLPCFLFGRNKRKKSRYYTYLKTNIPRSSQIEKYLNDFINSFERSTKKILEYFSFYDPKYRENIFNAANITSDILIEKNFKMVSYGIVDNRVHVKILNENNQTKINNNHAIPEKDYMLLLGQGSSFRTSFIRSGMQSTKNIKVIDCIDHKFSIKN